MQKARQWKQFLSKQTIRKSVFNSRPKKIVTSDSNKIFRNKITQNYNDDARKGAIKWSGFNKMQ